MSWIGLDELADEDRRRVIRACTRRRFTRGEIVFHAGDPAAAVHFIDRGRFAVRVSTPLGDVATLAILGAGDVFGELALLGSGNVRSATVAALETAETLMLTFDEFDRLRREHPPVDRLLSVVLAEKIRDLSEQLLESLYLPADTRILRRLLALVDVYGDGAARCDIPLTQTHLAELTGATRPTVNRVLRAAEDAGVLELRRGGIAVDRAKLEKRAR